MGVAVEGAQAAAAQEGCQLARARLARPRLPHQQHRLLGLQRPVIVYDSGFKGSGFRGAEDLYTYIIYIYICISSQHIMVHMISRGSMTRAWYSRPYCLNTASPAAVGGLT